MDMNTHYQRKVILCLLLIALNIVIRIPSVAHEMGGDTFQLHALANSISQYGEARWWVNWLSVFGMYSYSYASAVPFSLSGISQVVGVDGETSVYIYSLALGLLSCGTAYIMAGAIYNEFLFKYLMSLFYSISAGILLFTFWNASARGVFLVMFPLFVFILLKKFPSLWKKSVIMILLLIFLRSAHNFFYFTIPLILVYISIKLVTKANISFKKITRNYQDYLYLFLACIIFMIPFMTKLFITGSKYQGFISILITTTRYVGPIIAFLIPGFLYLALKSNKTNLEYFMLFSTLFFIPIFYSVTYGKFIILPLVMFYITIAVKNMILNKKNFSIYLIIVILSLSCFSSFYSNFRTGSTDDYFYMSEEANAAGLWTKNNMQENTRVYTTGAEVWRMLAISDGHINFPTLPSLELTYGLVDNISDSTIPTSPYSMDYYFEGPYVQKPGTSKWGEFQWYSVYEINNVRVKKFIDRYDIKYIIYDRYSGSSLLIRSLSEEKSLIYHDGRIHIWEI